MKKQFHSILVVLIVSPIFFSCSENQMNNNIPPEEKLNVLIFSKTAGFRHESIEPGAAAMKAYFDSNGISSVHTEDSSVFTGNGLSAYEVIIFFNTTGNILDSNQHQSLIDHVKSGKGFVGIHSASDTEYDWPWYGGLVGAYFASHPQIQPAAVVKMDTSHISCKHLPERWTRTDEWYNFKQIPSNVNVVLSVDESTYEGGAHGTNHPVSWYHMYDGGRSFYTAMGHTVESYSDSMFLKHILEATRWAGGKL